ncbi:MAG: ribosome-associated translation inhibitor RaiA [Candidatus Glassbacteria bacterium]|nr:ribosome-associated translation inhibitor RaiA [Candidatus Glassbacteria bacterium]
MRINITGKHRTLSDSLKEYIEKEVTELTHYYERIIEANVVLEKEGKNQVVAINLRVAGQTLITENRSTNLRVAIDSSVDKLAKQLVKYKQKWQRKGPKSPEEQPVEAEAAADTEEPMLPEEGEAVLTFEEEDQAEESTTTGS